MNMKANVSMNVKKGINTSGRPQNDWDNQEDTIKFKNDMIVLK